MAEIKAKTNNKPEFSRLFEVEKISEDGETVKLKALKNECAALAKRFKVQELKYLKAEFDLVKKSNGKVHMEGYFTANIVQSCVVTLEPVTNHVKGELDVVFCDEAEIARRDKELAKEFVDDDGVVSIASFDKSEIEPIVGGVIDLGEVIAQHLMMGIDPYPRKEGAVFTDVTPNKHAGEFGLTTSENPFAVLASLKDTE